MSNKKFTCHLNLSTICARVAAELGADSAGIALLHRNSVRYVGGYGFEWERLPPLPLAKSLIGATVAYGSVFASPDIRVDPRCTTPSEAQEMGMAAFMGCPLKDEAHDVFGVLTAHRRDPLEWAGSQVRMLQSLASLLGTFLLAGRQCVCSVSPAGKRHVVVPADKVLIVRSEATLAAFQKAERIAGSPCNVLITGERGTGKDVLARYIHDHSGRTGSYVAFNCATAPDELFEAELFGHTRGAFTGADDEKDGVLLMAERGTILLDEVAELSSRAQGKFLRALDNKEIKRVGESRCRRIDVRILGATNRDIVPGRGSTFLKDLYDRIAEYVISVPPLRDRPEDLDGFIHKFLGDLTVELGHPVAGISEEALRRLRTHSWPGNIRELKRVLRAAIMDTLPGHLIPYGAIRFDLPDPISARTDVRPSVHGRDVSTDPSTSGTGPHEQDSSVERGTGDHLLHALYQKHQGNVTRIAKEMGVTRQTSQKRLRRIGLR